MVIYVHPGVKSINERIDMILITFYIQFKGLSHECSVNMIRQKYFGFGQLRLP